MRIYNSLSKSKEEFISKLPNVIKMYVCGQTVHDYCHLGHARKAIVFDMVRRWFIASGYTVTFIENITDIDDKIIDRANVNNETITKLTDRFTAYMYEDFDNLKIMRPDIAPKATNYINQMLTIIDNLVSNGYAYQATNGDVYYSVHAFKDYGKLSGRNLNELHAGERVEIDPYKHDPLDFVLWKSVKDSELHTPHWPSKFGNGRPGWHIECSAMAYDTLGESFDIHGGGLDLTFPHHENEIAQTEAHTGHVMANYWMHNGFLNILDEKMSKSVGNFFTIRDVLKQYNPEILRFFILKTHYRSPLNFSFSELNAAKSAFDKLYRAIQSFTPVEKTIAHLFDKNKYNEIPLYYDATDINWQSDEYAIRFKSAMDDDFNTPQAISVLFEIVSAINNNPNSPHITKLATMLLQLANSIGILYQIPNQYLRNLQYKNDQNVTHDEINHLINQRNAARVARDYTTADRIRDQLSTMGVILEDNGSETRWSIE